MAAFLNALLTASLYGSVIVAVILLLRLVLRKAPKKYICLLWLLAAVRLLMPVEIQSDFSLQPELGGNVTARLEQGAETFLHSPLDAPYGETPVIPEDSFDQPIAGESGSHAFTIPSQTPTAEEKNVDFGVIAGWIWAIVAFSMVTYSAVTYLRLRRQVADAVILSEGIWITKLDSAMVLGFFRPRIYLSAALEGEQREYVLRHEQCHIHRGDHWWKWAGFIVLALHWFNPLVWLGYALLCRDLEMACDEAVIRNLDVSQRKSYSFALLSCSAHRHTIAACPVAFGEVSVKERIKNVLNYKKPAFWIIMIAVIAVAVVAVCFLTSPKAQTEALVTETVSQTQLSENDRRMVQILEIAMENLRQEECYYIVAEYAIEGYPPQTGNSYEVFGIGDTWMYINKVHMAQTSENWATGGMMMDGVQYRYGHARHYTEDRNWTVATENQRQNQHWLLSGVILVENITQVVTQYTADTMEVTLYFNGPPRNSSDANVYGFVQTWYLDLSWNLLKVTEGYTMLYTSTEGAEYYVRATNEIQILDTDPAEIAAWLNAAAEEIQVDNP